MSKLITLLREFGWYVCNRCANWIVLVPLYAPASTMSPGTSATMRTMSARANIF